MTSTLSLAKVSVYDEVLILCGDVLFKNGQGRTDFDGGDSSTLKHSIEYILNLDKETLVLPGHYQPFRVKNRLPCNLATK